MGFKGTTSGLLEDISSTQLSGLFKDELTVNKYILESVPLICDTLYYASTLQRVCTGPKYDAADFLTIMVLKKPLI